MPSSCEKQVAHSACFHFRACQLVSWLFSGTNVSFVGSNFLHNAAAFHGAGIMCIFGLAYIKDTVIADNM